MVELLSPCATLAKTLRQATLTAHRTLYQHPLLAPLLQIPLAASDYADALAALHAPQAALEAIVVNFAPLNIFPPRLSELEADLALLGTSPYPLMSTLPTPNEPAAYIGYLYVLEGSNLGGVKIAKLLKNHSTIQLPCAFFASAGGAKRWQRFWDFVAIHYKPSYLQAACDAACQAFAFYQQHLDACLALRKVKKQEDST